MSRSVALLGPLVLLAVACSGDDAPRTRTLTGVEVATITFPTATDAWVSTSGTMALYQDGDTWRLGTYGHEGQTSVAPVDEVSVLDDHEVYEFAGTPPLIVIDQTEYTLTGGTYVGGDCHWCKVPFPDQPVVADVHDGTWKVTVGSVVSHVAQPSGWDRNPPAAGLDPAGNVVIVASLGTGGTAVVEGKSVCAVDGQWSLVAAEADRILLHKVDPARLDHRVVAVDHCV